MEIWEGTPGGQALTPDIHFIPMRLLHILRLHSRIAQVSKATNLYLQVTKKLTFFHVTNKFLFVSSSVWSKQLLCFVHGQGQKRAQKHTTKNSINYGAGHLRLRPLP